MLTRVTYQGSRTVEQLGRNDRVKSMTQGDMDCTFVLHYTDPAEQAEAEALARDFVKHAIGGSNDDRVTVWTTKE